MPSSCLHISHPFLVLCATLSCHLLALQVEYFVHKLQALQKEAIEPIFLHCVLSSDSWDHGLVVCLALIS